MYPAPFEYHSPATLAEAVSLLAQYPDDAKVISGGQSLVPLLKLRLASPKHLVDLRKVPGLVGVWDAGGVVQVGGMTTHRGVETSEVAKARIPAIAEAAAWIGDAQVRNAGTIGGSLAHADPSADWPSVCVALGASVQIVGKGGERSQTVEEFITGPLSTTLLPDEIVVQVRFPVPGPRTGAAYQKLPHPASRFAIAGVAAVVARDGSGNVASARIAVTGVGPKVFRASAAEAALTGKPAEEASLAAAAAQVTHGVEVRADAIGSADYKAHLTVQTALQALRKAVARAA